MTAELFRAACAYIERLGFPLVVANPSGTPAAKWFPHGASNATTDLGIIMRALQGTKGATLAARVGRRLVLDVDAQHGGLEALGKLLEHFGPLPTTWTQKTPSGGAHVWFEGIPLRELKGKLCQGVEAKRGNVLVTLSPSKRKGRHYEWTTHPLRVPLAASPSWIVHALEVPRVPERRHACELDPAVRAERARKWLLKAEPAVSGQHGHARTFHVAQVVARGFDLDEERALALLAEWNHSCDPPWSERELKRKVREALRRGRIPFGEMLAKGGPA